MIQKLLLMAVIQGLCVTGFCQSLSLQYFGTPFQRTNLDVRWKAPKNALPKNVWVYHLKSRIFSEAVVSNLMAIGSFTIKDKRSPASNLLVFNSSDGQRNLTIDNSLGLIHYEFRKVYSPASLVQGVPSETSIPELTDKYLSQFGIPLSEIEKNRTIFDSTTIYSKNHIFTTNTEWRGVRFRRSVDEGEFVGNGTGGDGEIDFGANGQIIKIDLSWRTLERAKQYSTASPQKLMEWLKSGKAVQTPISMNELPIDWPSVKSLTIKQANVSYYAGPSRSPSEWLMPLASLWATVERDNGASLDLEIDCPVFSEK